MTTLTNAATVFSDVSAILAELRRQGVVPCGVSADSRRVAAGEIFIAMPGLRNDGRAYIDAVLTRGVAGIIWESVAAGDLAARLIGVPNVAVAGLQGLAGALAHEINDRPSEHLWLCGITGTNGKTSVSQWIAQALGGIGRRCGVIGTLGTGMPGALLESANTTPDVISVHNVLSELVAGGTRACAMEVSSIGLDQGRVNGAHFDTVVFTNLTRDHLEYHGNMLAYAAAKARLFALPGIRTAVINLDDPLGVGLAAEVVGRGVHCIGYSLDENCPDIGSVNEPLIAHKLTVGGSGISFSINTTSAEINVKAPLLGRFNAANLLAVIGALRGAGVPLELAVSCCANLTPPAGRLQIVAGEPTRARLAEPLLVVDYAHTPDALEQALKALREVATARGGRLFCIFGCGGERDPGKRPLMGRVAERFADAVLVTSDNPRSEDPQKIVAAILDGMKASTPVDTDRAAAICNTVRDMQAHDVLLIAGKGHESYQEIAGQRLPYSDLEQAQVALNAWRDAA